MATETHSRRRYGADVIQTVKDCYPHCRSAEDKLSLARRLEMKSPAALYNLACRHKVTSGEDRPERDRAIQVAMDPSRRLVREHPQDTVFTADTDNFIRRHFGRTRIEVIAQFTEHTETAIASRARSLGVRRAAQAWELGRVKDWLGASSSDLRARGVALHQCCERSGEVRIVLVRTTDLGRALVRDGWWRELAAAGADLFFIREVIEAVTADALGNDEVWDNQWVSHGHTCLNPFSGLSFDLFYDGEDEKLVGAELDIEELSPERIHLLR